MITRVSDKPSIGTCAFGTRKSHPPLPTRFASSLWAASHSKRVVTAKYMAELCVRIVIVSRNYRAWVEIEILNERQDIAEHEH